MTGFFVQNTAALLLGISASAISHYLLPGLDYITLGTIAASGYISVHLPNIQQPTLPSYRIVRSASWLATLLIPLSAFLYRPTDLLLAWLTAFLFTSGLWAIFDRISLRRDFTRSIIGIALLPLLVTGCAYLGLGKAPVMPVFITSNCGYMLYLLMNHFSENKTTHTLPATQNQQTDIP